MREEQVGEIRAVPVAAAVGVEVAVAVPREREGQRGGGYGKR